VKILTVTPEIAPFIKVGGLADVVGALPKALNQLGHDVRVLCPLYGSINRGHDWACFDMPFCVPMGPGAHWARIWETLLPNSNVRCYFLEFDEYFARNEVYEGPWGDHYDNDRRFAFLSRAAIELCEYLNWIPDLIHCHDWATAFVPVLLNTVYQNTPLSRVASVLTIHNLDHQGYCDRSVLHYVGLPDSVMTPDNCESMGAVSMLKGGIYHATKVTTVSESYAREIQTPEGGSGLHNVLKFRAADLVGIINGIDTHVWTPKTDILLPAHYSLENLSGKSLCKQSLIQEFGLEETPARPIIGIVSRLYSQKGLDLLQHILPRILTSMEVNFVVLGSGDKQLEGAFTYYAERYRGRFGLHLGFSESLAHSIYAGADFFLMPSRFEPCGLGQLYAMTYGTLPIVRSTGGLIDTVEQYREGLGWGTGFRFDYPTCDALYFAIGWACSTYYDRPHDMQKLIKNGMRKDFSWLHAAKRYEQVFKWAVDERLRL
jgi:starch synthase